MKCPKCNSAGRIDNNRYWNAKYKYPTDYYLRFEPMVNCNSCKGSGYIIGNLKDVFDLLQHLKVKFECEGNKEYLRQINQCLQVDEIKKLREE